ncbi:pilus assembly protein [Streptomyces lunaelactis]|uniref:TadE family type IV pilus minor pilin n=1 Tax=Streptomyces lunaelactis TaxID=1535768 RepID=UPI001585D229|nr:TadE family type IV pilus minor pilin [Streptomyces lunaelactis]NUK10810.1 pilus assembly protein [Streptomyces lunaelactis]NUK37210.1 pilus assembly protein [Streptomyces lunaelactis]NUK40909.1 pilus assembly protein [Streptomyces lunaelactis]NUK69463.1 pilus assembly protein [Streptomyces lunaelactis]NUK80889.1 pilus assembly protein [Streptomyces lunaelactis]
MRSSEGADRGSVTAEAAVAVPALVVFAMALVWALMAASAQIQCVDAARAGARAAARSEPRAAALAAARSAAPEGARVTLGRAGELWRVRVEAKAPGPGALALTLSAEAASLAEDTVGGQDPSGQDDAGQDPAGQDDAGQDGATGPGAVGHTDAGGGTGAVAP